MIDLINIGVTGAELVDKINEIIATLNALENVTDYNQLQNRPSINGVILTGDVNTAELDILMSETIDYQNNMNNIPTRNEVVNMVNTALNTANQNAQNLVSTKMDANHADVPEVSTIGKDAFVYINSEDGLKKIKMDTLANNVSLSLETKTSFNSAVAKQKRILKLSGNQDGNNVNYFIEAGYVPDTSDLFFNGQRLIRGVDYMENSSYEFTMLTQIPNPTDRIVFVAVPLN